MDRSKLSDLINNFEKQAQNKSEIDNLVMTLSGLYSLAAFVEQKVSSNRINDLLNQARKLQENNPQDVVKAKEITNQIKGIADYLKKIAELITI